MGSIRNIFSDLKDWWMAPPLGAFSYIKYLINGRGSDKLSSGSLSELKNYEITPPSTMFEDVKNLISEFNNKKSLAPFSQLYNYEVVPSANLFKEVIKEIKPQAKVVAFNKQGETFKRYAVAAAMVIFFVMGAFYLYQSKKTDKGAFAKVPTNVAPKIPTESIAKTDPVVIKNKAVSRSLLKKIRKLKKVEKAEPEDNFVVGNLKSENVFYTSTLMVGPDSFAIKDNDVFATFASFDPDKVPSFLLSDDESPLLIKVDDFTSISISPAMRQMLKRMYQTKRNGKLTLRARREKSKLEKWKIADSTMFDSSLQEMPTDPMSLSDLLKK